MKYVLWVLQVLLGLAFVAAGFPKLIQPYAELAQQMTWVSDVPEVLVRFIGVAEVLGGLGLILPAAIRILPWLTPVAAAGLALDMLLATLFHLVRGEVGVGVVPLCCWVSWRPWSPTVAGAWYPFLRDALRERRPEFAIGLTLSQILRQQTSTVKT